MADNLGPERFLLLSAVPAFLVASRHEARRDVTRIIAAAAR
jgi:hypothetical protein